MPYVMTIEADTIDSLTDKVLALAAKLGGSVPADAAAKPKPEAVKPKPAAEPEPDADATVAAKPKPKPTPKPKEPEAKSEEDFANEIRETVVELVNTKGRSVMEEILSRYGVARASLVAPEQREELLTDLKDALAA